MLEGDNAYLFMRRRRDNPSPETFPGSLTVPPLVFETMYRMRYLTDIRGLEHRTNFTLIHGKTIVQQDTVDGSGIVIGTEQSAPSSGRTSFGIPIVDIHTHPLLTHEKMRLILERERPDLSLTDDIVAHFFAKNKVGGRLPSDSDLMTFFLSDFSSMIVASKDANSILVKSSPLTMWRRHVARKYGDYDERVNYYREALNDLAHIEHGEDLLKGVLAAVIYPYGSLYFSRNITTPLLDKVEPDMSRIVDPPVFAEPVRTWREGRRKAKTAN